MPNRIKDASFTFAGQRVHYEPNSGSNFIHGLVNRHAWQPEAVQADLQHVSLTCSADFSADTELGGRYPFPHRLLLTVEVRENRVRWSYAVDNTHGAAAVPFGFALHPYFNYLGERAQTYLTIPASHWMESTKQLPSGKLIPASALDFPLGKPMSLQGTQFDDVFFGLHPGSPTRIEFRDRRSTITIKASEQFSHLVVWTPNRPYFGVESQTCSTDAHNLYAQGFKTESQLRVCPPGETRSGWVEYRVHVP